MPLLFPNNDREKNILVKWASDKLHGADFGQCRAIGVHHGDEIVAVAIYNGYRPPNIDITFVTISPRWASPKTVKALLRYPFKQLGCKRITAITEATNQPARAFLCRLGFKLEGIHPGALLTGDAITYGLLAKDAARWLEEIPGVEKYAFIARSARSSGDCERANCL